MYKPSIIINMDVENLESLEKIKASIEKMEKFNQVEILKILSRNLCKINENKSGVYVNLSFLSSETLAEVKEYIEYTRQQEFNLVAMEYQKEDFKNSFFIEKENKDNKTILYSSVNK